MNGGMPMRNPCHRFPVLFPHSLRRYFLPFPMCCNAVILPRNLSGFSGLPGGQHGNSREKRREGKDCFRYPSFRNSVISAGFRTRVLAPYSSSSPAGLNPQSTPSGYIPALVAVCMSMPLSPT